MGRPQYWLQNKPGMIVSTPCDKIFDQLDVSAISRKNGSELLFGRLEHAEGRAFRPIDNLNILQRLGSSAFANARRRTDHGTSFGRTAAYH
jgi:hypothetical protein